MKMNKLDQELAIINELSDMGQNLAESQRDSTEKSQEEFVNFKQIYQGAMHSKELLQDQLKAVIRNLQNEYETCTGDSDKAIELKEMVRQEEQLKQEYCAIQERKEELSTECKILEKKANHLKIENEKLQEDKERRDNETTVVLPLKREELRLLTSISGIRWDFEGITDKVEGYITNRTGVKNFSFDKTVSSQFTMTNSLWDSMSED